jgi:hypothetical protein
MSTTPTAPRRGTPRSPSHFTFDIAPVAVAPHTSALSAMSAAMALPYAAGPSAAAAAAAAADPAAFLVPQTTGRSYAEMEQIHATAVEQAAREQWLLQENRYQQHQEQQHQDQASRAAAFVRRFADVFRDDPQTEHDENEAAADEDYALYSEHEQGQEDEQFAIEHGVQRGEAEAEADWAALNSSRPMPAPSAAELFEQQQHSWDELNAYHRQQQQEQEHEQQHEADDYAHAADDQHQHQPDQYHRHQPDKDADQFDEAHAAVLETHQEREAHHEHQHQGENEHAGPNDAQLHPANAQLHDDLSRLAHRRRQQRTAAVEQHFTAAVGAWSAKRAARGGGARVHRSLQMAMDASTAVAGGGGGGGVASLLAMGGVRSSGNAGYSTSTAAAASASANLRGELLFDSDLEEDDDMGAEAFSFGLTSRIKAARTQFWDSVENISNHLTSLEIEYVPLGF